MCSVLNRKFLAILIHLRVSRVQWKNNGLWWNSAETVSHTIINSHYIDWSTPAAIIIIIRLAVSVGEILYNEIKTSRHWLIIHPHWFRQHHTTLHTHAFFTATKWSSQHSRAITGGRRTRSRVNRRQQELPVSSPDKTKVSLFHTLKHIALILILIRISFAICSTQYIFSD